ncbi:MFS transporter [Pinisolibacter aquiterrae]|uniref:MFS transporter n=1 Tax=Pinisolibacter aquiterrae TaxID=2815579 RepID=UPI001C3C470E|nr:MFS transporter [Pinisolibacter aquiterrae]MBV5265257.1 MFS transporter [Pinisolibacter aquiterrae]MCC8235414.1 MFS transporter [Pinisolibacter aquiterrae]
MIPPRTVAALSLSQLIGWGTGYYAIGVFAPRIAAETGWTSGEVHAGFSIALVVMGLVSAAVGRRIDRDGGRAVMTAGSLLLAVGLGLAGLARSLPVWWGAWALLGVALRMTLYDACFAALVRVDPADARRAITTVTLTGGLASTVFWFLGDRLAEAYGWRAAFGVFAAIALASAALPLTLPTAADHPARPRPAPGGTDRDVDPHRSDPAAERRATALFAVLVIASAALATALAAHMIPLLLTLGVALSTAVTIATLRGIGQSVARAIEFLSPRRLAPLDLSLVAAALLPASLALAPFAGLSVGAAALFSFAGGAGNGLMTIARGTVPLVLFEPAVYGTITGRIAAPAFWVSALTPFVVALALDHGGPTLALALLAIPAVAAFAAALALALGTRRRRPR